MEVGFKIPIVSGIPDFLSLFRIPQAKISWILETLLDLTWGDHRLWVRSREKFPLPCDINRCDDNNNNNNNNKESCIYGIFITKVSGDFNGGNKRPMKVLTIQVTRNPQLLDSFGLAVGYISSLQERKHQRRNQVWSSYGGSFSLSIQLTKQNILTKMLTKENCSYCFRASFGDLSSPLQASKFVLYLSKSFL